MEVKDVMEVACPKDRVIRYLDDIAVEMCPICDMKLRIATKKYLLDILQAKPTCLESIISQEKDSIFVQECRRVAIDIGEVD